MKFTNRDGKIRIYDSTPTPYYLQIEQQEEGDFSGPAGIPSVEEILVLNRQQMDQYAHYVSGPDSAIMEGLEINFSVYIEDSVLTGDLVDLFRSGCDGGTTQVNSITPASTKGDTQRVSGVANPAFADSNKLAFNVEYLLNGATDICMKYNEVWFDISKLQIQESADGVTLTCPGLCYGTIVKTTAFTSGAAFR